MQHVNQSLLLRLTPGVPLKVCQPAVHQASRNDDMCFSQVCPVVSAAFEALERELFLVNGSAIELSALLLLVSICYLQSLVENFVC